MKEKGGAGRRGGEEAGGPRMAPAGAGPMLMNSDDDGLWVRSPASSGSEGGVAFIIIIATPPY